MLDSAPEPPPQSLADCFRDLRDPRLARRTVHSLHDILSIILLATIAGCDDFVAMADYARARRPWLQDRMGLNLGTGVPSHDTLQRTLALLQPQQFEVGFARFVKLMLHLAPVLQDKHIAIDGKAMRGSNRQHDDGVKRMVHMVGAWSTEAGLALGQVPTDAKSNEIPAIPKLLEILDISGALVTIDAMGCQKEIAATIVGMKGDDLLQVKGNQERLHEDVQQLAAAAMATDFAGLDRHEQASGRATHGRHETRWTVVIDDPAVLAAGIRDLELWKDLRSVVVTTSVREVGGRASYEMRYHISNRRGPALMFGRSIRRHWGIENECHWVLDVAFREDDHRLQDGHAAANLSTIRRMALSLLKRSKVKLGMKNKRLKAGYDTGFVESVMADFSMD